MVLIRVFWLAPTSEMYHDSYVVCGNLPVALVRLSIVLTRAT